MHSSDDLVSRIQQIAERAKQRPRPPAPEPVPKPAKVTRLPLWPEEVRACPSSVLRSALFGVVRRGRRSYMERQVIAAWANTTIRYAGMRLDQADLDVWLAALHITRESGLGAQVRTSIGAMLKAMGRTQDGRAYEDFNNTIVRLTGCVVEITANRKTYGGSLIESFERDEDTGYYVLYLNPRLVVLFEDEAFALIDWEQRHRLRRDLSKWLHRSLCLDRLGTAPRVAPRLIQVAARLRPQPQGDPKGAAPHRSGEAAGFVRIGDGRTMEIPAANQGGDGGTARGEHRRPLENHLRRCAGVRSTPAKTADRRGRRFELAGTCLQVGRYVFAGRPIRVCR